MKVWPKSPVALETHLVVIFLAPEYIVKTEILDNGLRAHTKSLAYRERAPSAKTDEWNPLEPPLHVKPKSIQHFWENCKVKSHHQTLASCGGDSYHLLSITDLCTGQMALGEY